MQNNSEPGKPVETKELTMSNTKKEMVAAYRELLTQLQEERQAQLKPEEKRKEKQAAKAVEVVEALSADGVVGKIGNLKSEIGTMLNQLSDKLEQEVSEYNNIKEAIRVKDSELREIYEIERAAASLAALIEAENQKKQGFDAEMATRKKELGEEILEIRLRFDNEKNQLKTDVEEMKAIVKKKREREKEEYEYCFERERRLARETFEDEKARLEIEVKCRQEEVDKREREAAAAEAEMAELRSKVEAFPEELETAVSKAVKASTESLEAQAGGRQELLAKEYDGERNVLKTRIESLEQTIKEQSAQISLLSQQLQKSYDQVEGIALRAVESSANLKPLVGLQQIMEEQRRKSPDEK